MRDQGLATEKWKNALTNRAQSYEISPELKKRFVHIHYDQPASLGYTLCEPHKVRYKRRIIGQTKPVALNVERFAAAKFRYVKSWFMRGGERHLFEMKHDRVGKVRITVHPNSVEYYQVHRHRILASDIHDATTQLGMALEEAAVRFQTEMRWCGVEFTYGDPVLTTSPDYSFRSRLARQITDRNQTHLQLLDGQAEVDKSLEDKYGDTEHAELEVYDEDIADTVDRGLRNAANIDKIVPALVQNELKGVTAAIEGIHSQLTPIAAMCQSGLPMQNQLNQACYILGQQSQTISDLQKTVVTLTENMTKILQMMAEKEINKK